MRVAVISSESVLFLVRKGLVLTRNTAKERSWLTLVKNRTVSVCVAGAPKVDYANFTVSRRLQVRSRSLFESVKLIG